MCAINAIVDFIQISCISTSRICTIHVINIANDWVRGRQRGQISPPWEIIWHWWGASSLSLCAINAIVDFFHISCISALRICTIYVINIDDCSDRGRQRGQISSSQQIIWHRLGASSLSLCAINAIVDFFHISCISALRICTIYVINIDDCSDRGRQRGQISSSQQIIWHRLGASSLSLCAINAIVDFFHISCISALRICTIYVINIDDCSDRGRQRGQISSSQQIIWHRLGASSLSMCAINTIIDFLHILH